MASRYNLLSSNDYELLPEDKISQLASLFGGNRTTQSDTPLEGVPTVQPEAEVPKGGSVALGRTPAGDGGTLPNQSEIFRMMVEQVRDRERRAAPLIQEGRRGVDELAGKIRGFENQPNQVNVAPVLNWLDSQYGTNLSKGYERPMNEQEKLAKIAAMYKELQGSREKTIEDALRYGTGTTDKILELALMQGGKKEKVDEVHNQQVEKDVQKLGEKVEPMQKIGNSLAAIEGVLGFKLDDADTSGGELKVKGKKKDLPGVSLPFIGRTSFYDDNARALQGAMGNVFNVELKDRSGAAVTSPELERLKVEFGSGKFNTEADMISGLKRYKAAAAQAMKNAESRFRPEAIQKYKQREGQTSDQVFSSGGTLTPSEQEELKLLEAKYGK